MVNRLGVAVPPVPSGDAGVSPRDVAGTGMADTPPSAAGGVLVAICSIGGAIVGLNQGQVTIGFLAGLAIGAAGAVAVWWRDSRR